MSHEIVPQCRGDRSGWSPRQGIWNPLVASRVAYVPNRSDARLRFLYDRAQRRDPGRDRLIRLTSNHTVQRVFQRVDASLRSYPLHMHGGENLPRTGPGIISAIHQDGDDVTLVIASAFTATGRVISPLVEIDTGQTRLESLTLEMLDVTWAMRGAEELAKRRQRESYEEMLTKAQSGHLLAVWSEGTFCPRFDDVLPLYTGGSVRLPKDYYELTGQKLLNYPEVTAYEFDESGKIRAAHVQYLEPFDAMAHGAGRDLVAAAEALRQVLLTAKRALYAKYMPGLTPAQYSRFRAAGHKRHPHDPDYYDCGHYCLPYRLAQDAPDEQLSAEILAWFADG